MAGTHGVPGSAAYSASKFATLGLAGSLALELAKHQITVNSINPGMVATNLRDDSFTKMSEKDGITWEQARQRDHEMLNNRIPLGRLGKPEEIADLAYFLVSDQSVYITGESVNFTGGVV
jgi:NAD(P)-dependent dehydrogenase (short-subunit alcohol dehydrogenase family)